MNVGVHFCHLNWRNRTLYCFGSKLQYEEVFIAISRSAHHEFMDVSFTEDYPPMVGAIVVWCILV
jgi:hypothetical protein